MLYGWANISSRALTIFDQWRRRHISRNERRYATPEAVSVACALATVDV
jgi:hypothetical protein